MAHTRYQNTETTDTATAGDTHRNWARDRFGMVPDEWRLPAIFATVTVVVGLSGLLVSSQVEPLVRPVTPQAVAGSSAPVTTDPSSAVTPATTGVAGDETIDTTAPTATPAAIGVSADTIDFGPEGIATEFEMTNTGGEAGEWTAVSSSEAIAFSAVRGTLSPGETVTLRVSLDRSLIPEGELAETVTVQWAGGQAEISAVATHEDNPIIHNPRANPAEVSVNGGDGCSPTQTTVSARIRDTSPIESAVVRWSPDGSSSQETAMISVGNDMFEAVIGPFTAAQSASVKVVGVDDRGNAGGASITVPVNACP